MEVTSEEVSHRGCEAVRGPPQKLLLLLYHPVISVLVVQTSKEKAVISHLEQNTRVTVRVSQKYLDLGNHLSVVEVALHIRS